MSITVKQTIVQQVSAPSLGIVISESEISVNITYTAKSVMFLSGNMATVEFETSVEGGLQTGSRVIDCAYSGNGNPLDEAEAGLKAKIEALEEARDAATNKASENEQIISEQMALAEDMAKQAELEMKMSV
ncbi:hypothetical protein [Klebsiella pneumoniae]|uniref:hypothetical protein n=1 Tax=Klebsiella pneumoniae TaxID=573 RepID=UPI001F1C9B56|nr:hypothetical protein [Klebsiella pneumoniae]EKX4116081.1 hypothetical protein [Klebsiella pneumoniae]MCE7334005.1 hypothetical protein [Klebsiella pneumoniae]